MNFYEYALGGTQTHETGLYHRLEDNNLIRHGGDRHMIGCPLLFLQVRMFKIPTQKLFVVW